ncbi:MAG: hypothetical protein ABI539_03585 [Acidobacteriota bacterium]
MLSILTEPTYPKAALGLEADSITAIALQKAGRGSFGVKQAATVELPNKLLVPNFLERNIASREEFRVLLEDAVASAGLLNQKNWSVSLPSSTARTAILSLDTATSDKGEIEDVLDWKAEQTFGAPAAELRITRNRIADDRQGKSRFFATAVKLTVIDEYETVFESLGWKAGLILPRPVSESRWLSGEVGEDSLLVSSQPEGFTALLMRGNEATVVRSVTCAENERDDEIFRLLMFYRDRFADASSASVLDKMLIIGKEMVPARVREISAEALGQAVRVLGPEDIGLSLPGGLKFDDIAAPAGLATYGWR